MIAAIEKCTVCGAIIQQVANKYRLAKVPLKAEGVNEHTKIGQTLLNVTKSPGNKRRQTYLQLLLQKLPQVHCES